MSPKRPRKPQVRTAWIHSSRLHVVLYSMLLIATPFILLQNFLVETIGAVSSSKFELFGRQIPIVPTAALVLAAVLLIRFRALLTRVRVLAALIALLLITLAQQITDYYFGHNFYDLQQNWHYIAYGIFAFMMYRDLAPRGVSLARIMLITYGAALLFSAFDEAFQMRMSNRVFDLSDTAKDVWGTFIGMVLVYLGGKHSGALLADWRHVRHPRLRDYANHPFSLLILMTAFGFLFICFSSLLSDFEYWKHVVLFTAASSLVFFLILHVSQYKWVKYSLLMILTVVVIGQCCFFVKYRSDHIIYNRFGLTVYRGIPIPFFDVLIFPDGTFRPVDKKHYFNSRDQAFFLKHRPDVLLIGSGVRGEGGNGFHLDAVSQFVFNRYTERATQVIILKTPEACRVFNRLKREGKNVLFVLHNTC
jgi:VanZ family protein